MEHLYQTFLHSVAWHAGTNLVHMLGMPILVLFVGYGIYRFVKQRVRR